tara:strand:+ start:716 stop:949 length:234 start_codon:yes stop_codon:yes gene_type:complete
MLVLVLLRILVPTNLLLEIKINIMPMLILHCRIRLFLAFIQQRTLLGGAPTITVAGTAREFHSDFPPCISARTDLIN